MIFLLPQPNLKAKDLPYDFLPAKEIIQAFKDANQEFEFNNDATVHDRTWHWFCSQTNGNARIANQELQQEINALYRVKTNKGEFLFYGISLTGINHKGESIGFYHTEGIIENIPVFEKKINPDTTEVESGPLIHNHTTLYNIPFTKKKIDNELSPYFADSVQYIVKDKTGRKYTCNLDEFRDLPYEELINLKTGYTDYMKNRQLLKVGGVK